MVLTDIQPNRTAAPELERLPGVTYRRDPVSGLDVPPELEGVRTIRGIFTTLFIPLLVLGLMPRVRPRRALPLILTYIPPILPILIWWDGFASTMRSYRAEELRSFIGDIEEPGYSWRVEELSAPGVPIPVTIVVGRPVES